MEKPLEETLEFAENPQPRCPVVLLLDTSGSMNVPNGAPIKQLNAGLKAFDKALKADRLASLRVEVAIITFGGVVELVDPKSGTKQSPPFDAGKAFITADDFQPPTLEANGETPMGETVRQGLKLLRERKDIYQRNNIQYFRPWMVLITDGWPTDKGWEDAADQVKQAEARDGVVFYGVGVEKADMETLARFSDTRKPFKLKGLAFPELFNWLGPSVTFASTGEPGRQQPLPPPEPPGDEVPIET